MKQFDLPTSFAPETLDDILEYTTSHGSSDLHIQSKTPLVADVYGRLVKLHPRSISFQDAETVITRIYGQNAVAQIYDGKAIDTSYEIGSGESRVRFRVNAVGVLIRGSIGIQITIRTIPTNPPTVEDLNVEQEIIDAFLPSQGLVVVTGPTGSGKSTLLASLVRKILEMPENGKKIVTYEAPIEFVYDAIDAPSSIISQSEVPSNIRDFAVGVENALRRKPDIILIGEARDPETIEASVVASQTGHLVYTTAHTNGVAETIRRMVNVFPSEERSAKQLDIIDSMQLIVSQRLVKTLDGKRAAIKEYLVFDSNVKEQLTSCHPDKIASVAKKIVEEKGTDMISAANQLFLSGAVEQSEINTIIKSFGG